MLALLKGACGIGWTRPYIRQWIRQSRHRLVLPTIAVVISATPYGNGWAETLGSTPAIDGTVDAHRMQADETSGDNWLMYGRTYSEQRFSPLQQINDHNVSRLGLAWSTEIASPDGLSATPIVVDGVIYLSGGLGLVVAIDAETGKQRWSFRPDQLDLTHMFGSWTARFNRGAAVWKGKVFVATGDCRLFALRADTGAKIWEVPNCDPIVAGSTGAPRIAKDMVLIGDSGADNGARGYVSAYDTETGKLKWRFFTVPGEPANGFEQPILASAAKTWIGKEWWKNGGGSVWDSIVYDPELNQVYIGTDSSLPWGEKKGDSLFTNSIVALDADTGTYKWHYQETPADAWDYNATMQIVLADLKVGGESRKVLMQAPKNGFFYVIDRKSGKLLSADKYVRVTWASRVDLTTGRPIEASDARYYQNANGRATVFPYVDGGHNWQAMSYSPLTGLVYIPGLDTSTTFYTTGKKGIAGTGVEFDFQKPGEKLKPVGRLIAWDPVAKAVRWSIDMTYAYNGGTLATAGNIVFQGTAEGIFIARDATNGQLLWSAPTVSATQAPPVTFRYHDKQYVVLPVGASGVVRAYIPEYGNPQFARGPSRLLAFVLGGNATVPPGLLAQPELPKPPTQFASAEVIAHGKKLYEEASCFVCHGIRQEVAEGGSFKDLRYIPPAIHAQWNDIVLGGELAALGMPSFKDTLSASDAQAIRAFIISRAQELYDSKPKRD
jgi:quinohemoprotein ethanol dehydrogenase